MLKRFKITTCAFILCLFGLTIILLTHVQAQNELDPEVHIRKERESDNRFKSLSSVEIQKFDAESDTRREMDDLLKAMDEIDVQDTVPGAYDDRTAEQGYEIQAPNRGG